MTKVLIILTFLISFFCANRQVYAQSHSLSNGDRIRITATKYFFQPTIATFEELHSDSVFLNINNRRLAIPVNLIKKVEVLKKQTCNTVKGMIAGSIVGGLILGIWAEHDKQNEQGIGDINPGFWGGFASGTLLGGGIGALIGSQVKSEKWEQFSIKEN